MQYTIHFLFILPTFVIFSQGPSASAYITYVREEVSIFLADYADFSDY